MPKGKRRKSVKENEVMKALSPEETTMLSNISSIIDQLISGAGGEVVEQQEEEENNMNQEEAFKAENDTESNMKTTEELDEAIDDEDIEKELVTTQSDSSTASNAAEEIIDETQTELTEGNVDEVAKALSGVLKNIMKPNQQKPKKVNPLVKVLEGVTQVQKSTQEQVNELNTAFSRLLEGLGVTEQMKVHKASSENSKGTPYTSDPNAQQDVVKSLVEALQNVSSNKDKTEESNMVGDNREKIRKNLSDPNVLSALVTKRK